MPQKRLQGVHRPPQHIYAPKEAEVRLKDIFHNHGLKGLEQIQLEKLSQFYYLLMQAQKQENFTRLLKFRDVAIKHFIDCLMVPNLWPLRFPLMDMGSGAGFPGLPLKIYFPKDKIILAEGVGKRVDFLKKVREELSLEALDIIGRKVNSDFAYPVASVITRAVSDFRSTLKDVSECLIPGGEMVFMKGPKAKEELEIYQSAPLAQFEFVKHIEYCLPHTEHERSLVIFRKSGEMQ